LKACRGIRACSQGFVLPSTSLAEDGQIKALRLTLRQREEIAASFSVKMSLALAIRHRGGGQFSAERLQQILSVAPETSVDHTRDDAEDGPDAGLANSILMSASEAQEAVASKGLTVGTHLFRAINRLRLLPSSPRSLLMCVLASGRRRRAPRAAFRRVPRAGGEASVSLGAGEEGAGQPLAGLRRDSV
jgi:hypothetical protein